MSDPIAPPMSDNEALRRIVATLDQVIDRLLGNYTLITGNNSVAVTQVEEVELRALAPKALRTVVTNTGSSRVKIFEGGKLVAILNEDQTWESPTSGKLRITARCVTPTETTTVAIATYKEP